MSENQAMCSCLTVKYEPEHIIYEPSAAEIEAARNHDGPEKPPEVGARMVRERWVCQDCGTVFARRDAAIREGFAAARRGHHQGSSAGPEFGARVVKYKTADDYLRERGK